MSEKNGDRQRIFFRSVKEGWENRKIATLRLLEKNGIPCYEARETFSSNQIVVDAKQDVVRSLCKNLFRGQKPHAVMVAEEDWGGRNDGMKYLEQPHSGRRKRIA